MDKLMASNQECREAVTNIDGKMVLKLNKCEITAIKYEMTQIYLTRDDYNKFEELQAQLKDRIENMEGKIDKEIENSKSQID